MRDSGNGREHELLAGSEPLIAEAGIVCPASTQANTHPGFRRIIVAIDGCAAAEVVLDESPRERADEWFRELVELGFSVAILTGDAAFSNDVWPEIPRQTGLKPEEKATIIRERQASGSRVVFVGDGLNDGPALAVADASIALLQGSELARSNAMAVVAGERLGTLPQAVKLSRKTLHAIESNLRFAAAYNTVGMAIAAAGWLHPVLAALLMAGSSFFVSARVLRVGGRVGSPLPTEGVRKD
jgi:P-type E1-E2 ATPase